MKKFSIFAYYYTLILITVLVIGAVFFMPEPFRLVLPLALLPSLTFFWLNITQPEKATESEWSYRVMLVVVILISLGIYGFMLLSQSPKEINVDQATGTDPQIEELNKQIEELRRKLESDENDDIGDTSSNEATEEATLGDSDEEISSLIKYLEENSASNSASTNTINKISGYVRVTSKSEIDVYQSHDETTRIIGIASLGSKYPFFESKGDWYMIEFDAGKSGWVKASDVTEVD